MPSTFWIIILFQVIIYIAVYLYKHHSQKYLPPFSVLLISAVFGFLLGAVFDYVCIYFSTHTYFLENGSLISDVTTIPFKHLLFNGVLSYGLYIATLYYFLHFHNKERVQKRMLYVVGILLVLGVVCTYLFIPKSIIQTMIFIGLSVISLGEITALLFGVRGPVVELVMFRKYHQFFIGYLPGFLIGLLYEGINYLFPFWVWAPYAHYPTWFIESGIIIFGYYILTHPIIIFWRVAEKIKIGG